MALLFGNYTMWDWAIGHNMRNSETLSKYLQKIDSPLKMDHDTHDMSKQQTWWIIILANFCNINITHLGKFCDSLRIFSGKKDYEIHRLSAQKDWTYSCIYIDILFKYETQRKSWPTTLKYIYIHNTYTNTTHWTKIALIF